MSSPNTTTPYQLTLYSVDYRWSGEAAVPSHRRLSDYVNDTMLAAITLTNASTSVWMNESLRDLRQTESVAIHKRNTLIIASKTDVAPSRDSTVERVQKVIFRILVHLPSYTVIGNLSLLPHQSWLNILTAANQDFFPITKVNVWRTKTGAQIETDLGLVLVNRQEVIALEPTK
jgi:hypothetical protein